MEPYFIKMLEGGEWGYPEFRADLMNYTLEDLASQHYYPLVLESNPQHESNQKLKTTYNLVDGVVYQHHSLELKTGDELNDAIFYKWQEIRMFRDNLLKSSDWTQLGDVSLDPNKKEAWSNYRQELRDITKQLDPFNISWPYNPEGRVFEIGVARVG